MNKCKLSDSDREKFGMVMALGIKLEACGKDRGVSAPGKCFLPRGHGGECSHCGGYVSDPQCLCNIRAGLYSPGMSHCT